ncbi:MAG TPA: hypothetical protein VMV98_06110 [Acidobacteriaceae bacterium]|nr:hypothetical protein [Acidobacteriaceae bacterium]
MDRYVCPLRKRSHLIWADKFALAIALSVAALAVLAGVAILAAVGTASDRRLDIAVISWTALAEIATALPAWLIMRAIDFMSGGHAHRLKAHKSELG